MIYSFLLGINMSSVNAIEESYDAIEKQIESEKKDFDFDIREYPLEFLQQQFNPSPDSGKEPDLYIPDYQRDFVWSNKQQSLFIESLLIGLPVPYIFGADISSEEDSGDGRVEIIDGAQRVQTIDAFMTGALSLVGMERLPLLENKTYEDLPPARKRRFNRTTIRMIELSNINEDGRRMMFARLNTGGTKLSDMEKRRGTSSSPFMTLVDQIAQDERTIVLTPLPQSKLKRREREEYVLRFFAYLNNYQNFNKSVQDFLAEYIIKADQDLPKKVNEYKEIFFNTFDFVTRNFEYGFKRSATINIISRVRFEAISVGVALAIRENPALLRHDNIDVSWAFEEEFLAMIRSDASNSRPKVIMRIEYVKDKLLAQI
jgi:hypothetical protein